MEASAVPHDRHDDRSGGKKAAAVIGGLIATLLSALWLYVFIEVLRDADETRTTKGFEKVISAVPGIPAAVIGLGAIVAGIMYATRNARGPSLLRTTLIGFAVATLIYIILVIV